MGRVVPPGIGAALCQCGGGGRIGCCGSSARTMGTLGDVQTDFYASLQGRATAAGKSAEASLKAQTGVDVTNARVQAGAAAAVDLAQNGFNPNDPESEAKLVHAIAGGAALLPGVGPLIGGAVEGLYAFGKAIACPTEQFFASVGLSTLPPQCGGAPCKSSGNWTTAGIIASNAQSLPAMPRGSFAQFAVGALATGAANAANCKGALPPGVIVDAAIAIWNKTHAGPIVAILIPPLNQTNSGITAFGSPSIIAAWQNISGSTPASKAGKDPYAFYAFGPASAMSADHPSGSMNLQTGAWTPWKVAPALPGGTIAPPRIALVNMGPILPPAAAAAPAPVHKTLAFRLGPQPKPAASGGMSTGAKVATYAAAGGGLYALLWWLWKNGFGPSWGDVVSMFKAKG